MADLKNSEIIEHILQTLVSKIGRRTSESFAVVFIDDVIKELKTRYSFLRYVQLEDTLYSEGMNAISIMPDIDAVESTVFYRAVEDLIKMTVKYLEKNADFYFIKEFQEAINDIDDLVLKEKDVNLGFMQSDYISYRKETLKIKNSEVVEPVLKALINVLNRKIPETQAIKTVVTSIKKLEEKYDFLKYIEMIDTSGSDGLYLVRTFHDIDNIWVGRMAGAIQQLIEEVGKSSRWKNDEWFVEAFKIELGDEQLSKIEKMGVNLDHIKNVLSRQRNEVLVKKALESLVDIIGRTTSKGFAVIIIDTVIKELEGKHDVLKYIKIDESRYMEGSEAISIMPDINSVEPYKLGKAIREIIRTTYKNLEEKTYDFIEEFKKKLGDKYISEIENLGVNLHFLEMEFR